MKQCSKCREWKAETDFSRASRHADGLHCWCKTCKNAYQREAYRKATKGRLRKYLTYEQRHRVVRGVKQKRCYACKTWKAESDFYKDRTGKDGLARRCKKCADKATNECRRRRRSRK